MIGDTDGNKKNLNKSNNIKANTGFGIFEETSNTNNFVSTEDGDAEYQISSNLEQHVNTESMISNNLKQHLATDGTNKNKLSELSNIISRKDENNTFK